MSRLPIILLALASSLLLAACSGEVEANINTGDEIDGSDLEAAVLDSIAEQTGSEPDLEIDCPTAVKMEEGDEFDCDVVSDGEVAGVVHVEQTSDDGDVDWVVKEFLDGATVESEIRRVAGERGIEVGDVECPEDAERGAGNAFECRVDDGLLEVMQVDDEGGLEFGELRPAE